MLIFAIAFLLLLSPITLLIVVHQGLSRALGRKIAQRPLSKGMFYASAMFGTPLHELSHAVMALLFRHKIHKIKFFQFGQDGRLGYVEHNWNRRSIYQSVGMFFIAIAPMLVAMLALWGLATHLDIHLVESSRRHLFTPSLLELVSSIWQHALMLWGQIFTFSTTSWLNVLWLLLASLVCFHCVPSTADFKHALKGGLLVGAVLCAAWFASIYLLSNQSELLGWTFHVWLNISAFTLVISVLTMVWWLVLWLLSLVG
ncbi:hypothetical protein [Vibrio algicola]|uniref:Uncharacterized protein n=1 Tax=Vibrio algicola TaxID=2662262 RepID=A0A5Q0TI30_9VIBR|nr:hypothetical protein [Vibrio algicola]